MTRVEAVMTVPLAVDRSGWTAKGGGCPESQSLGGTHGDKVEAEAGAARAFFLNYSLHKARQSYFFYGKCACITT